MTQPSDMTSSSSTGTSALGQTPSVPVIPASTPRPAGPLITVIEPDAVAPLDRLGEWLFASGARLRTIRVWKGEALPATDDLGDGLVVLGGQMSAHDDAAHPWLEGLREIIRHAVADGLPTLTICLGAQVAAEALGAVTAVPSPDGGEHGVAELELTEAALVDRVLGRRRREPAGGGHAPGLLPALPDPHLACGADARLPAPPRGQPCPSGFVD